MSCKYSYLQRTVVDIRTAQQVHCVNDDWVRNERVKSEVKVEELSLWPDDVRLVSKTSSSSEYCLSFFL